MAENATEEKNQVTDSPVFRSYVRALETAIGGQEVNGDYLLDETIKSVNENLIQILKTDIAKQHSKDIKIGNDLYEFELNSNAEGGLGTVYLLDGNGKRAKSHDIDLTNPHPALTAVLQKIVTEQEKLLNDPELGKDYNTRKEQIQDIKDKKQALTASFLSQISADEALEETLKKTSNNNYSADALRSFLKDKQKSDEDGQKIDEFIAVITSLNTQQNALENFQDAQKGHAITSGLFALFSHMNNPNGGYDPMQERYQLSQIKIADNTIALGAYDALRNMKDGQLISVETLKLGAHPDVQTRIDSYFKDKTEVTREEVYDYVRDSFNNYALLTLTGKNQEYVDKMSAEDKADMLKNVSLAMEGRYTRPGESTPTYFNPFEEDLKIVFKSFGRPDLTDPRVQTMIQGLKDGPGYEPPGRYAMDLLSDKEEKSLYEAGKHLITEDGVRHALEKMYSNVDNRYKREEMIEGRLERVMEKLLDKNTDYTKLENDSKRAIMGALTQELHPELYGNKLYNQTMMNFYEGYMGNFGAWRTGEAVRDANGVIKFDANGKSTWGTTDPITGTLEKQSFNSMYGGPDRTQLMHMYMRNFGPELKKLLGEKVYHDVITVGGDNPRARTNYDQDYNEIAKKLNNHDPSGELLRKMNEAAGKMKYPGSYHYWMIMNLDSYRNMRGEQFWTQEQAKILARQKELAALKAAQDAKNNEGGKGSKDGKGDTDQSKQGKEDEPTIIIPGEDGSEAEENSNRSTLSQAGKAAPLAGTIAGRVYDTKKAGAKTQSATDAFDKAKQAADPNDYMKALEKANNAHKAKAPNALDKFGHAIKSRFTIKAPAALTSVMGKFSRVAGKLTSGGLKGTLIGFGIGAAIGGTLAKVEVDDLKEKLEIATRATGVDGKPLVTSAAKAELEDLYGWYIAAGTGDVTIIGGDIKLKNDFEDIIKRHNIDPVTAKTLRPAFLSDIGSQDKKMSKAEIETIKTTFADTEGSYLHKSYAQIAKEHGLPATWPVTINGETHNLPIGVAMRDPNIADDIEERYTAYKKNIGRTRIKDTTKFANEREGLAKIAALNEAAGTAFWMIENQQKLAAKPRRRARGPYRALAKQYNDSSQEETEVANSAKTANEKVAQFKENANQVADASSITGTPPQNENAPTSAPT